MIIKSRICFEYHQYHIIYPCPVSCWAGGRIYLKQMLDLWLWSTLTSYTFKSIDDLSPPNLPNFNTNLIDTIDHPLCSAEARISFARHLLDSSLQGVDTGRIILWAPCKGKMGWYISCIFFWKVRLFKQKVYISKWSTLPGFLFCLGQLVIQLFTLWVFLFPILTTITHSIPFSHTCRQRCCTLKCSWGSTRRHYWPFPGSNNSKLRFPWETEPKSAPRLFKLTVIMMKPNWTEIVHFLGFRRSRSKTSFHALKPPFTLRSRSFTLHSRSIFYNPTCYIKIV